MTQDEIIELARQAGCPMADMMPMYFTDKQLLSMLEAFAKLVAEKEREIWARRVVRLQNLMDLREQQPNKPCCIAEREACAKICDEFCYGSTKILVEKAIRARGQA